MHTTCEKYRFIEKAAPNRDLTFRFYSDGKLIIMNNVTEEVVLPRELRGDSRDFYVSKRISFIKNRLMESQLRHAL